MNRSETSGYKQRTYKKTEEPSSRTKKTDTKESAVKKMDERKSAAKKTDTRKSYVQKGDVKNQSGRKGVIRTDKGRSNTEQKGNASKEKAPCPVAKRCGGCQLLHMSYEQQCKLKQEEVNKLLEPFGKVEALRKMKDPMHYRHKVHAVFDRDRKGNPISGVYEAGTHRVVPVDHCLIENELADDIIVTIRGMLKSFKIKTYDEDTEYGLLRHVLVRVGRTTGQVMVILVLASPILPSKNNFVKALRSKHPEISTVILNVNEKRTSMVLGERNITLFGKGSIEDQLCGKKFVISPSSFFQVNPEQTEVLYNEAIKLARLTGKERVIDAYCGIGTIGILASDHAKEVIGVELNADAIRDAAVNAKKNESKNIRFYTADAGEMMTAMAEKGEKADVVFMDPPRSGSTESFMDAVTKLAPSRVVYVSCSPETLARDLLYFSSKGYLVKKMIPVDMFPWTLHTECCVLLERSNL